MIAGSQPTSSAGLRTPVAAGLLGSVLVALGACSTAFTENPAGWGWVVADVIGGSMTRPVSGALITAGVMLLSLAWWYLRPHLNRVRTGVLVLIVWVLPLVLVPPVMSADPFLYADLGYILDQGRNPYLVRLTGLGGPYAPYVDDFWAGHGVAYPPLALQVSRLLVEVTGLHPYWGVVAQRLPALLGVGLMAGMLPRVARRVGTNPEWALWLGVLNPFVIVHLIGGAHNDAVMTGVVVAAVLTCLQRFPGASLVWAPMLLGVAMGLKQQAGLAAIAVAGLPVLDQLVRLPWRGRVWLLGWRTLLVSAVAVATFVVTSLATGLGFGWLPWLSEMGRARTITVPILVEDAFSWTGAHLFQPAYLLLAVAAVGVLAWLLLSRAEQPLQVTAWGSVLLLFMSQAIHPWYVGLCLALLALCPLPERLARAVVWTSLGYLVAYTVQFVFLLLPWVGVLVGLAAGFGLRERHRREGNPPITLG